MAKLKARMPCEEMLPFTFGTVKLDETDLGVMTSVMALGEDAALSSALSDAHGVGFPKANRTLGNAGGPRCIWFGQRQAMLIGPAPDDGLQVYAALVDQSDGWCAVTVEGEDVEHVLERLVPVDLRRMHFKRGHTARTQLGHISASITRTGSQAFLILVFRSMAASLVHELSQAMRAVASRRGNG